MKVVKFLINEGADINNKGGTSFTPLHWAASKGYLEMTKYLYEKGADLNI